MNTWTCPHCGEVMEEPFDACWKCGTARDGTPPEEPEEYVTAANDVFKREANAETLDTSIRETQPCIICGASDYSWGYLDSNTIVQYHDQNAGLFEQTPAVQARVCRACGNLQMFVDAPANESPFL